MSKRVGICFIVILISLGLVSCSKSYTSAKHISQEKSAKSFSADANKLYYAVRWALNAKDYPIASEDLPGGILTTSWVATKSDSHYIDRFGGRDYGVNGGYYRLQIQLVPEGSATRVEITPITKTRVANLKTSGREERRLFTKIADFLHSDDVSLSNIGIEK